MALPQYIKDLAIPQGIDARGGFSALGNNFANAVDDKDIRAAQERRIDEQLQVKNEHDLGVSGEAENAGIRGSGSAANATASRNEREKIEKKNRDEAMEMAVLLSMLDDRIAELGQEIKGHEDYFTNKHGDAWAEVLANKFLDPDIIPVRAEGEAMGDYRQRVKDTLIDEMLDEDGKIKDKYKNHADPDAQRTAKWAKAQYEQDKAIELRKEVEGASPERMVEIEHDIREVHGINQNNQVDQELLRVDQANENVQEVQVAITEATDSEIESVANSAEFVALDGAGFGSVPSLG